MGIIRTGWSGLAMRFLLARRQRAVLTGLGVALGAALLTAILTLGVTLRAGIDEQMRAQFGTWDVMVAAPSFTTATLEPATAAAVAALPEVAYAVPVLNRHSPGADTPVEFYVGAGRFPPGQPGRRLTAGHEPGPGEVALPVSLAQRLGATLGGNVSLPFPGGAVTVRLVGLVPDSGAPPTAAFDYTWLSEQLKLPAPPALVVGLRPDVTKQAFAARMHALFPDLTLDLRENLDKARNSLNGFGTVGYLLGTGALLASAFLVVGAFGITVQERTRELALLRAIGATPKQTGRLLLREAGVIGAGGALLGVGLGVAGAWAMVSAVARYLKMPAHGLVVPAGGVIGVGVAALILALLAAWPALRRAGRVAPLAAMRPDAAAERLRERSGGVVGIVLICASGVLVALSLRPSLEPPTASTLAALAALLLLVGMMAILPRLLPAVTHLGGMLFRRAMPVESIIAQRSIERDRHRGARTAGILVLGLTVLLAVTSLLQGEMRSKADRVAESFPTAGQVTGPWGSKTGFGDELVRELQQIPGVATVVPTGLEMPVDLVGFDAAKAQPGWLKSQQYNGNAPDHVLIQPLDYAALSPIYQYGRIDGKLGGGIAMTRHLADEMGLKLGQILVVRPSDGAPEQRLSITALVEHLPISSVMTVDAALVRPPGAAVRYRVAHVALAAGADRVAVKQAVMAVLASRYPSLTYRDVTDLLAEYATFAQQSMAIIAAATLILLVIAGAGMANTVVATLHARRREMAVLRAIGGTPAQVARLIGLESLLIGLAGSVLGVGTGALMAVVTALPGVPHGAGIVLPGTLMAVGLAAGPFVAVLVAQRQVRAAANAPLMGELAQE